jgi:hypothetical protein
MSLSNMLYSPKKMWYIVCMEEYIACALIFSSTNPMQTSARNAEFKRVSKLVKAKDPAKKNEGLDIVSKDYDFFTEGGCLLPLVDNLVPTKVSLKLIFGMFIIQLASGFPGAQRRIWIYFATEK